MSNNLSVSDITPLGERPADVWRGRTGVLGAGVFTMGGSPFDGLPSASGDFYVYDALTDSWVLANESSIGSGLYLTRATGGRAAMFPIAASGAAQTLDLSTANVFDITLTANCTLTFTNPPAIGDGEGEWVLILRQGGTGSYTVTYPGTVTWRAANGTGTATPATLATAVGAVDVVVITTLDGGAAYGAALDNGASGSVTSVALTVPAEFSVAGSPVTSSGTLAVSKATQSANTVWAGPTSGAAAQPTFRALTAADIPAGATGSDHEHVMDCLYSGDASATAFELPAAPFDAYSVAAYVAGVLTEVTLSGAMLTTATFGSAPASATNNIRFDIVAAVL